MKRNRNVTNTTILKEIGQRMRRERLNQNLSQDVLSEKAGISRGTLSALENGGSTTTENLVAVVRALGKLGYLNNFIPPVEVSPVQLAKAGGKQRKRARTASKSGTKAGEVWQWGE